MSAKIHTLMLMEKVRIQVARIHQSSARSPALETRRALKRSTMAMAERIGKMMDTMRRSVVISDRPWPDSVEGASEDAMTVWVGRPKGVFRSRWIWTVKGKADGEKEKKSDVEGCSLLW
jgi:hypothetical protein